MEMIDKYVESTVLSVQDRLFLTGKTERLGYSDDPSFQVSSPYIYPLYKLHKLSREQIIDKIIPPACMVTSAVNGPTYPIGILRDNILKHIAVVYCGDELMKDSTDFLCKLEVLKVGTFDKTDIKSCNLAALDVVALHTLT